MEEFIAHRRRKAKKAAATAQHMALLEQATPKSKVAAKKSSKGAELSDNDSDSQIRNFASRAAISLVSNDNETMAHAVMLDNEPDMSALTDSELNGI